MAAVSLAGTFTLITTVLVLPQESFTVTVSVSVWATSVMAIGVP